jgi:outer membrane murein-binding lipoprotein Lpp
MARRRQFQVFTLSFLDTITCGFGAVILLFTLISAQSGVTRMRKANELSSDVSRIEEQVLDGYKNLAALRNTLEKTADEKARAAGRADRVLADVAKMREELSHYAGDSLARRESIEKLRADVRSMDEGMRRLEGGTINQGPAGENLASFRGTGNRLYFSGLKVAGDHIAILVDASASMLDDTIVNVLRDRNLPESQRLATRKWRRNVDTLRWLTAQIPPTSKFQVISFNTRAKYLARSGNPEWADGSDPRERNAALSILQSTVPRDGTSLINAFNAANRLQPKPDNVILVTDGLPTQGESGDTRGLVRASQRLSLFESARKAIPGGAHVNVVLFPMEGDGAAPYVFWRLATASGGVFLVPSADWP